MGQTTRTSRAFLQATAGTSLAASKELPIGEFVRGAVIVPANFAGTLLLWGAEEINIPPAGPGPPFGQGGPVNPVTGLGQNYVPIIDPATGMQAKVVCAAGPDGAGYVLPTAFANFGSMKITTGVATTLVVILKS